MSFVEFWANIQSSFQTLCGEPVFTDLKLDSPDDVKMSIQNADETVFCLLHVPDRSKADDKSRDVVVNVSVVKGKLSGIFFGIYEKYPSKNRKLFAF